MASLSDRTALIIIDVQDGLDEPIFSLSGFIGFYTLLLVAELYLMFKYARLGPSSLHTGRYDLEKQSAAATAPQA